MINRYGFYFFVVFFFCLLNILFSSNYFTADDFALTINCQDDFFTLVKKSFKAEFLPGFADHHYRPITNIFYSLFGDLEKVYLSRFFIFLLHILNSLLVLSFFQKLNFSLNLSKIGSLLFLTHPVIGNDIFWFSALGDVLSCFFALIAINLFIVNSWFFIFFISFAFLSKESVIGLPFILLGVSLYRKDFRCKKYKIFIAFLVIFLLFVLRGSILETFLAGHGNESYFNFSIIHIVKYFISFLLPFTFGELASYPFLFLYLLLYLFFVKQFLKFCLTKKCLLNVLLIFFSMLPVLFSYGSWYLYFPLVFVVMFFLNLLKDKNSSLICFVILIFFSINLIKVGFQYKSTGVILDKFIKSAKNDLQIIGVPIALYTNVPFINSDLQFELAQKRVLGKNYKFVFKNQTVRNGFERLEYDANYLYFKDNYSYFYNNSFKVLDYNIINKIKYVKTNDQILLFDNILKE